MIARALAVLAAGLAALAGTATTGRAATAVSTNWSGYVVSAKSFTAVSGKWVEPTATCTAGSSSSTAVWVGIGGTSKSSDKLEQIGTEVDCSATGSARYSMWYELVPAAAVPVRLTVAPGDSISASVKVNGTKVTLRIENLTRKTVFSKTVTAAALDLSSAEWIVEAPSACSTSGACRVLSLADFGTVRFSNASATAGGHTGSISDSAWSATSVVLASDAARGFGGPGGPGFARPGFGGPTASSSGGAVPGALTAHGRSFSVAWKQTVTTG